MPSTEQEINFEFFNWYNFKTLAVCSNNILTVCKFFISQIRIDLSAEAEERRPFFNCNINRTVPVCPVKLA